MKNIVYIIGIKGTNYFKIGCSRDLDSMWKRFLMIDSHNHKECQLLGYLGAPNGEEREYYLHKKYHQYRVRNEWFKYDVEKVFEEERFIKYLRKKNSRKNISH